MNESLTLRTARGVAWSAVQQFSIQAFNFVVFIILARLLFPKDFGIVGMAAIFMGLVALFNELGLSAAIVQKEDIRESHLVSAFWLNFAAGIVIFLVIVLISPLVATFFKKSIIRPIMIVSSIGLILGPFGVVHSALLTKNLEFKKLAIVGIIGRIISGTASVVMAFSGFGVWSLVLGDLMSSPFSLVLLWYFCSWRPKLKFEWQACRDLLKFGINVMGTRILNYSATNVDYLLVGKFLGATSLGLYTFAYQIITWPTRKISALATQVTFPAFSTIQQDDERIRRGYLKMVKYISVVTFPLMLGMLVVAREFVTVLYGQKWALAVIPLQLMCIAGLIRSVVTTVGTVFLSKGRPDIELKLSIVYFLGIAGGVALGLRYGINGVALAVTIVLLFLAPIVQFIMNRLIHLNFRDYLSALFPALWASLPMLILVVFIRQFGYAIELPKTIILLATMILGALIYLSALKIFQAELLTELLAVLGTVAGPKIQEARESFLSWVSK